MSAGTICPVCEMDKCRCRRKAVTAKKATVTRWVYSVQSVVDPNEAWAVMHPTRIEAAVSRAARIDVGVRVGPIVRIEIPVPTPKKARKA